MKNISIWAAALLITSSALAGEFRAPHAPDFGFLTRARLHGASCDDGTNVTVDGVTICGRFADKKNHPKVVTYKGIKFANAPRWQDPVLLSPSAVAGAGGTINAVDYGPTCPQAGSEFLTRHGVTFDEDCLSLNIWTPSHSEKKGNGDAQLPVLVYIYGGAFVAGGSAFGLYDGTSFADGPAVVVTMNYRLGAFGFLVDGPLGAKSGNYGLKDQQAALRWVKAHISAFGGNPDKVMLFGESAGAMSTALHTFSIPSSSPLFRRALMESNVGTSVYPTPASAEIQGRIFRIALCRIVLEKARLDTKGCAGGGSAWKNLVTTESILEAQFKLNVTFTTWDLLKSATLPWGPVADGSFVVGQPLDGYAPGTLPKPVAFGVNADEGALFFGMINRVLFHLVDDKLHPPPPPPAPKPPEPDLSSIPVRLLYRTALGTRFPFLVDGKFTKDSVTEGWKRIIRNDPKHYEPGTGATFDYSQYGRGMANVFTDYTFVCGDVKIANAAVTKAPVFAYYFSQPNYYDLAWLETGKKEAKSACSPGGTPVTCHGYEVPYVFDILPYLASLPGGTQPGAGDIAVSLGMRQAWLDFARLDDISTSPYWKGYDAKTQMATHWEAPNVAGAKTVSPLAEAVSLEDKAHCKAIWNDFSPLNGK